MALALEQARHAMSLDEVPVGAVIVLEGNVIAKAHNQVESQQNPCLHAEMLAIQKACAYVGYARLLGAVMYTTLEPCPMCAGAILQARLRGVVYGAMDHKWGGAGSIVDLFASGLFNHKVSVDYSANDSCSQLLTDFFKAKRKLKGK